MRTIQVRREAAPFQVEGLVNLGERLLDGVERRLVIPGDGTRHAVGVAAVGVKQGGEGLVIARAGQGDQPAFAFAPGGQRGEGDLAHERLDAAGERAANPGEAVVAAHPIMLREGP